LSKKKVNTVRDIEGKGCSKIGAKGESTSSDAHIRGALIRQGRKKAELWLRKTSGLEPVRGAVCEGPTRDGPPNVN